MVRSECVLEMKAIPEHYQLEYYQLECKIEGIQRINTNIYSTTCIA